MPHFTLYNYHPCWSVNRRFVSQRKVRSPRVTLLFSGRQIVGSLLFFGRQTVGKTKNVPMMTFNLNYHVFFIISQYITDRIYQLYVVLRNKHSMTIFLPCPHLTMFYFPGKCTLVTFLSHDLKFRK
jgi:hypothetical protein